MTTVHHKNRLYTGEFVVCKSAMADNPNFLRGSSTLTPDGTQASPSNAADIESTTELPVETGFCFGSLSGLRSPASLAASISSVKLVPVTILPCARIDKRASSSSDAESYLDIIQNRQQEDNRAQFAAASLVLLRAAHIVPPGFEEIGSVLSPWYTIDVIRTRPEMNDVSAEFDSFKSISICAKSALSSADIDARRKLQKAANQRASHRDKLSIRRPTCYCCGEPGHVTRSCWY